MSSFKENNDDDMPRLSIETLRALQEFYAESQQVDDNQNKISENWQLSQFWYDKATSETLAKEVIAIANEFHTNNPKATFNIACISCPTLFDALMQPQHREQLGDCELRLFEFDERFGTKYGMELFVPYDYKRPLEVPYSNYFQLIVADPPFLSAECLIKTAATIRHIGIADEAKLIVCTGAVMQDLLDASLKVKLCSFVPKHERNLANEFKCYANYETHILNK